MEILYGRNAGRECLRARRRHIHKVLIANNVERSPIIEEITTLAEQINIPIQRVPRLQLDKLVQSHQGVVLQVGRYPLVNLDEMLARATKHGEPPFLIVLDHINDPHNLGAMLRTAEAVGVHGLIIPKQRSVGVTPAVVKASAGATEHIWIAQVPNLVQAIKMLKQANVWVVGVENERGAALYAEANLADAIAVVIGGEGQGLSRLVKETCDFLVKLPMRGQIESLNASVACGLILYEVWRRRNFSPILEN